MSEFDVSFEINNSEEGTPECSAKHRPSTPANRGNRAVGNNVSEQKKSALEHENQDSRTEEIAEESEKLPVKKITTIVVGVVVSIATLLVIVLSVGSSSPANTAPPLTTPSGNEQVASTESSYKTTPSPISDALWNSVRGSCGTPKSQPQLVSGRIVGGAEAVEHSWPWQIALLNYKDNGGGYKQLRHVCGGTLVGPDVVITAVHCFLNKRFTAVSTNPTGRRVLVGGHAKATVSGGAELVEMLKIYHHPKNNLAVFRRLRQTPVYDITIIRLKKKFSPSQNIPAIGFACLPKPKVLPPTGKKCWSSGWGNTQGTGFANVLKQTTQPIISQTSCKTFFRGVSYDHHLCARVKNMGTCQGDSGGPLVCQGSNGKWTLYGATSFGPTTCVSGPGVFASVAQFLEWVCCTAPDLPPCAEVQCPQ